MPMPAPSTTAADAATAPRADRDLVEAVLAGRRGAFEQLVRTYQGLCWRIVDDIVRHPDDTRELCQEVFLRIHRSLHQYRGESALKSWVAQVACSVALRHIERKRLPLADIHDNEDGLAPAERVSDGFDLETATADEDMQAHLHAAIDALPPLQRMLLTLYHLEEMPIGDIARSTGLAEGTIKSHLFRSRKRLREILEARIGVPA
ncbi:sigma-70 family RNA polymerase sigma factor [Pseudoxanthomonas sp. z9]|uniref:RNA polymerase sigma factor n=1 Tax=Pseudoxanthomonas sp. z9 TaxID=2584942 RepID=UPI00201D4458|nr:sigma-70 family RNA polymerase sigma factor [Pseudoxanthomonas sp. z9]MCL6713354.1 sigma-70 family RNA polymerase sigma factor [Pseudomonas sp. R2.Fl]